MNSRVAVKSTVIRYDRIYSIIDGGDYVTDVQRSRTSIVRIVTLRAIPDMYKIFVIQRIFGFVPTPIVLCYINNLIALTH